MRVTDAAALFTTRAALLCWNNIPRGRHTSMSNPNPYGASGDQNTPWPQYGENAADPTTGYPGAAPAGYPGAASPGYQGAGYGGGPVAVQLPAESPA